MDDIKVFLLPAAGALLSAATIGMFSFADSSDQNQTEPEREDKFGGHKNLRIFYWVFLTLCNVGMGISLTLHQVAWPPALKALCIVSILWPCAWSDFRTMHIPNKCLLVGLGYRAILFIFNFLVCLFYDNLKKHNYDCIRLYLSTEKRFLAAKRNCVKRYEMAK